MDTDRLQTLADNIRSGATEAEGFYMHSWFDADNRWAVKEQEEEPCGTTACICGEALLEFNGLSETELLTEIGGYDIVRRTQELLDLSEGMVDRLAFIDRWPDEFEDRYKRARERRDKDAERNAAADRIEHLIEHYE